MLDFRNGVLKLFHLMVLEIFGIVDNTSKVLIALRVPDRSQATLRPIITQFSAQGSRINTDGWGGYNYLGRAGWRHVKVCHKLCQPLKSFFAQNDMFLETFGRSLYKRAHQ